MTIQEILLELNKKGFTDQEIGNQVNAPQSIICRLRCGVHKTTGYERGRAIESFYNSIKKKEAALGKSI